MSLFDDLQNVDDVFRKTFEDACRSSFFGRQLDIPKDAFSEPPRFRTPAGAHEWGLPKWKPVLPISDEEIRQMMADQAELLATLDEYRRVEALRRRYRSQPPIETTATRVT